MSLESYLDILKQDEGFSGVPYVCTGGAVTIGYGHNLDANPLTKEEAEFLLRRQVLQCIPDVIDAVTEDKWMSMGHWRRTALVNMRYQLGSRGFRGFLRMLEAIKRGDYEQAAKDAMDSRWAAQTPARADRVAVALAEDKNTWRT